MSSGEDGTGDSGGGDPGGWGWHDPARQAAARERAAAVDFRAALPFAVLLSPQGHQVMTRLRAMTYLASCEGPPALTPEMALYKEAQSNLVRWIERQVAAAAEGPPAPATATATERE